MSKLFKIEKVRKFFDILERQNRTSNKRYIGWSKLNPHIEYCEKQVFAKRVSNSLLPSKYIKLYNVENKTVQYLYVCSIRFHLGWSNSNLEINYIDYANLSEGLQQKKLSFNDIIYLEGEFLDGEEHKKVLELFRLKLPEKTYRFEAFDFDKYPKRVKKGVNPKELIKTFVDIVAITEVDAFNKRKALEGSKLMITEKFEVIADMDTKYLDDNGNKIFLGAKLKSEWGFEVIVKMYEDGGFYGQLVCNDKHSCKNMPYALNNGRGYKIAE